MTQVRVCRFETVSAERLRSPTFPWSVKAAGSPVEGALRFDPERRTYTNMAVPRPAEAQPSLRSALCLLLLCVSGLRSSTLHLPPGPLRALPQDRGFFAVGASVDFAGGDGGALAARAAAEGGSSSGASPQRRSRRSAGESAMPKVYGQANLNDSHNQMVVHWAGEKSNVIVALARDSAGSTGPKTSSVYVSYDYGTTFTLVSEKFQLSEAKAKDGGTPVISQFYHSPADNRRYIFVDATNDFLWNSYDFCRSVLGFALPFKPTDLLLHSRRSNLVLGYDGSHPSRQLWKSDDFGETWVLIQEHVKTYFWGVEPYDPPTTVLVQRSEPQGVSTVLSSTDFFQSKRNRRVILEQVDSFQLREKYMFATTTRLFGSHEPSSVQLWVSYNRQPMKAAQFMTRHPITEYYIADASEDQVFVCVNHLNNLTHLYISDTQGLSFSLSLENVLYYSPEGSGGKTLIRYFANEPFADLHRVEGLRGVFIATLVNGSVSEDNMRSVITFDKGGTWELLLPPAADSLGGSVACQPSKGCSLHLAQRWSQLFNIQLRRMPILSKDSAPGLIMATGSVGRNLANKPNVYVSSSAGARWREALAGPHFYTWGDHGGILMAISQGGATTHLKFSTNEGETWTDFRFSDREVYVYQLLTEPGEKSTIFTIFGSYADQRHSWLILQVNTSDVLGVPCSEADYKRWAPSDERGNDCLLGREVTFKRRAPHATCFNGEEFDRPVTISNCSCTRQDYECDYGFKLSDDLSLQVCVPDPEFTGDLYAPPVPCPVGSAYRRSKGYRKVPGDSCGGGDVESRLDGEMLPCPVGESNEFILYAVRNAIHRYDLATGMDQPLPLNGLREAVALDFDYDRNCLYWADISLDTIQRLCLNGSTGQEVVVRKDLQNVEALSFDPVSRLLYWVDAGAQKIEVSNSDGDLRHTLLNASILEHPRALVLIPGESLMFWTDWGDRAAGVYRGFMDGTNVSCIASQGVRWPNGITADDRWLYWTEAYSDRIERSDFRGGQRSVLMEGLPHPYAIAVFKNELYWDDWSRMGIFKAPKAGSQSSELIVGRLTGVMDLKIFYKGKNRGLNACADRPCSLLCLPQPGQRHTCVCPDGAPTVATADGDLQCQCPSGYQLQNKTCVKTEHSCLPNQYRCSNGRCISSIWKCDSDNDCGDMSDEQECPTTTCDPANQFRCVASGSCIPLAFKCDHEDDCGDNSDEEHCESHQCGAGEFTCARGVCIREAWRCDGDNDCRDWSDEANCTVGHHTCEANSFQCHTGHCIPQRWMCDGDDDCQDGSDEDPQYCEGPQCNGFLCSNQTCLPATAHCNGVQECSDGADEHNCEPLCTRYMEFVCKNRAQCLFQSLVCDGIKHCKDGSDEDSEYAGCAVPSEFGKVCDAYTFQCANGVCVSLEWKCDGMDDCGDYSDEANCAAPTDVPGCSRYFQFECKNGRCIPTWWKCDGENDCRDWSDETQCTGGATPHTAAPGPSTCAPNRFHCGSGVCVIDSWVCDGYADCPDGSDELGCPTAANGSVTLAPAATPTPQHSPDRCSRGHFLCLRPPVCIPDWQRCDGRPHCQDGSDEARCPTRGPLLCLNGTRCSDGEACLLDGERCDGFLDCSDHSDEDNCTTDTQTYKVQNLHWTPDFYGSVTLTWSRPKNLPLNSCSFLIYYRVVGTQPWTTMDTHSNKAAYKLTVLKPDTTYQVKVLTQCLSKLHKSNELITVRTPEGLPDPPGNLQLSCDHGEDGKVQVSWSAPDKAHGLIREYIVEYSEKGGLDWTSQRCSATKLEVKDLQSDTLYKFRVAAVTSRGVGNWSEVKSITPKKALPPPSVVADAITADSMSFSFSFNSQYEVKQYVVYLSWQFDTHVKESRNFTVADKFLNATNLTAGTVYEVAVWAHTMIGDSPTALSHHQTGGVQPERPLLKSRALNQTAVECSWTVGGAAAQMYGVFYATSFLDLYRSPRHFSAASLGLTVVVDSGEQYLFLVRAISPFLGPPSDLSVVKMIPNERLPPRNLHRVRAEKTQAVLKWQPPYDSPNEPLTYAIHVRDAVRKVERDYKVTTRNNTVEYLLRGLEPGGRYSVTVRLRNMSKEASFTLSTVPLPAPEALKILTENDHVFLLWKSLAVREKGFDESRGYEVHVYDSVTNQTSFLGNTTETYFRISSLQLGHNYTFSVQARCLVGGQLCGEAALLLYDQLTAGGGDASRSGGQAGDMAAVVVPVLFLLLLGVCGGLVVLYLRHRRLQNNFTTFANSHYNSRLGSAIFSSGDELGDDDEDAPMISGFSDDVPMVIA
ncbi:sortilin-related receptor isoform X2 [Takifugu rubripes]|uniref:sortilin-related receptor isoform X2 n=1 Tax=Takifugu rubripes TaxID=31033 RepID=UPI00114546C6|nr:sortilin-related receptor isoform X2 [Takifugu rubripes]